MKTVTLTEANDKDFDASALGVDLEKLSNVQVFCVVNVKERVKEGHLHYVTLEFTENETIANPTSDPLIFCTIRKQVDDETTHCEHRALWENKLWRILDDSAGDLLELLHGIKKADVATFAKKLYQELEKFPFDQIAVTCSDSWREWKDGKYIIIYLK